MKKRRTVQEIKKIIEDYHKSGLPKSRFCKERKLAASLFYNWLKRKDVNEIKPDFIQLSVKNLAEKTSSIKIQGQQTEKIILKTLSGISLELPQTTSPDWILPILKSLL